MATTIGLSAYIAAFASYAMLALFYIVRGRWGGQGYAFLFATLLTAGWAAVGWAMPWPTSLPHLVDLVHHAASLSWILFLWLLIAFSAELQNNYPRRIRLGWVVITGLSVIVLSYDGVQLFNSDQLSSIAISLALLVSAAGLSLTETVFRSFRSGDRWGVKYLCLAIGGMFAYDVFFYSDALLYRQIDEALRSTRGFAVVLLVPFFVINIVRAESRHIALSLSAHMVFGSTVLLGAGGYLGVMAVAAYYIRDYGGTWSQALQVIFIFAAILLLCAALLSGTLRSFLRRFMAEHFQRQKFDYRREWRRLLQQISASDSEESLDLRVVKALADLVDSPAGALWNLEGQNFSLAVNWNMPVASIGGSDAAAVIDLFRDRDSVVDLWQKSGGDRMRAKLPDPAAFGESDKGRFLLPLFHHESLMGLVLLTDSRAPRTLDDEDIELVRMASRQAAGYLSEQRSARTLTEAREFEKFNRRYAFVTHDIKNLVSQLSLIVRNFEKHGHRPDFQRDMLATVQSAVERMNHLMDRLKESESDELQVVTVGPLIEKLIAELSVGNAPIRFDYPDDLAALQVRADSRRVDAIMRHLLQNAAESCGGGGKIVVGLRRDRNAAVIEVRDTGQGMDAEFVRNELFKPFRSTKRGGMGIGAYQCRTYARELGGDLEAISSVGAGTTMRVTLPLLRDA